MKKVVKVLLLGLPFSIRCQQPPGLNRIRNLFDLICRMLDAFIPAFRERDGLDRSLDLGDTESTGRSLDVHVIIRRTAFKIDQSIDLVDPGA